MKRVTVITIEQIEQASVPELLLAKADLVAIDQGYTDLGIKTPETILNNLGDVTSEINKKVRDDLRYQLRQEEVRYEAMAPISEKRKASKDRIADLKKKLGE